MTTAVYQAIVVGVIGVYLTFCAPHTNGLVQNRELRFSSLNSRTHPSSYVEKGNYIWPNDETFIIVVSTILNKNHHSKASISEEDVGQKYSVTGNESSLVAQHSRDPGKVSEDADSSAFQDNGLPVVATVDVNFSGFQKKYVKTHNTSEIGRRKSELKRKPVFTKNLTPSLPLSLEHKTSHDFSQRRFDQQLQVDAETSSSKLDPKLPLRSSTQTGHLSTTNNFQVKAKFFISSENCSLGSRCSDFIIKSEKERPEVPTLDYSQRMQRRNNTWPNFLNKTKLLQLFENEKEPSIYSIQSPQNTYVPDLKSKPYQDIYDREITVKVTSEPTESDDEDLSVTQNVSLVQKVSLKGKHNHKEFDETDKGYDDLYSLSKDEHPSENITAHEFEANHNYNIFPEHDYPSQYLKPPHPQISSDDPLSNSFKNNHQLPLINYKAHTASHPLPYLTPPPLLSSLNIPTFTFHNDNENNMQCCPSFIAKPSNKKINNGYRNDIGSNHEHMASNYNPGMITINYMGKDEKCQQHQSPTRESKVNPLKVLSDSVHHNRFYFPIRKTKSSFEPLNDHRIYESGQNLTYDAKKYSSDIYQPSNQRENSVKKLYATPRPLPVEYSLYSGTQLPLENSYIASNLHNPLSPSAFRRGYGRRYRQRFRDGTTSNSEINVSGGSSHKRGENHLSKTLAYPPVLSKTSVPSWYPGTEENESNKFFVHSSKLCMHQGYSYRKPTCKLSAFPYSFDGRLNRRPESETHPPNLSERLTYSPVPSYDSGTHPGNQRGKIWNTHYQVSTQTPKSHPSQSPVFRESLGYNLISPLFTAPYSKAERSTSQVSEVLTPSPISSKIPTPSWHYLGMNNHGNAIKPFYQPERFTHTSVQDFWSPNLYKRTQSKEVNNDNQLFGHQITEVLKGQRLNLDKNKYIPPGGRLSNQESPLYFSSMTEMSHTNYEQEILRSILPAFHSELPTFSPRSSLSKAITHNQ